MPTPTFLILCIALSTKEPRKLIRAEAQPELRAFIGGIARKNGFKALIGGTDDHVHVLLSLPATMPLAKAVPLLKGSSSRRMNKTHTQGIRLAGGLRCFHGRSVTEAAHD